MSTTYYPLRLPIARLVPEGATWRALDGRDQTVAIVDRDLVLWLVDRDRVAARRVGAGPGRVAYQVSDSGPDWQQVVSQYGEVVTLGELRRFEAAGSVGMHCPGCAEPWSACRCRA